MVLMLSARWVTDEYGKLRLGWVKTQLDDNQKSNTLSHDRSTLHLLQEPYSTIFRHPASVL